MRDSRVIAIDLRAQLFGYAVFEGPMSLLDWGRKVFGNHSRNDSSAILRRKVAALLTLFLPCCIVLKSTSGRKDKELLKTKMAVEAIREEAKAQSVDLVTLTRRHIHQAFRQSGNPAKHDIARSIAERFPELVWTLPPHRKVWQPEHHNMVIFDAVSTGLAYFECY